MSEHGLISDPPVRGDGRCARPGCRKLRRPERSKSYGGVAGELDPFCSSECCREWYGIPLPKIVGRRRGASIEEELVGG